MSMAPRDHQGLTFAAGSFEIFPLSLGRHGARDTMYWYKHFLNTALDSFIGWRQEKLQAGGGGMLDFGCGSGLIPRSWR